jgi:hypothetical protein
VEQKKWGFYDGLLGAEAAGYFLMKLGHPNIIFPLIIGKRYIRIGHEA